MNSEELFQQCIKNIEHHQKMKNIYAVLGMFVSIQEFMKIHQLSHIELINTPLSMEKSFSKSFGIKQKIIYHGFHWDIGQYTEEMKIYFKDCLFFPTFEELWPQNQVSFKIDIDMKVDNFLMFISRDLFHYYLHHQIPLPLHDKKPASKI